MKFLNYKNLSAISLSAFVACFGFACEQPKTGGANAANSNSAAVNSNANAANMNSSAATNTNGSAASSTGATIDAKEPEKYQAGVALKFEMAGAQSVAIPQIKADVAKSGDDRRMEFKLPTGETVVYLDKGGKQFIISPQRKQYAELNKEAVGVDVRRLLMPEQIVNQLKAMRGVEQVGEETVDGRAAVKYRLASAASTQQAGRVESELFVLVDKETGLPLRSYGNAAAQNNVKGINQINMVTEMNNIRTDVDQTLFNEPTDFQKVAPEQIRSQLNAIFSVASAVIGQAMNSAAASPTATP